MSSPLNDVIMKYVGCEKFVACLELCECNTYMDFQLINEGNIHRIEKYVSVACQGISVEERRKYMREEFVNSPERFILSPMVVLRLFANLENIVSELKTFKMVTETQDEVKSKLPASNRIKMITDGKNTEETPKKIINKFPVSKSKYMILKTKKNEEKQVEIPSKALALKRSKSMAEYKVTAKKRASSNTTFESKYSKRKLKSIVALESQEKISNAPSSSKSKKLSNDRISEVKDQIKSNKPPAPKRSKIGLGTENVSNNTVCDVYKKNDEPQVSAVVKYESTLHSEEVMKSPENMELRHKNILRLSDINSLECNDNRYSIVYRGSLVNNLIECDDDQYESIIQDSATTFKNCHLVRDIDFVAYKNSDDPKKGYFWCKLCVNSAKKDIFVRIIFNSQNKVVFFQIRSHLSMHFQCQQSKSAKKYKKKHRHSVENQVSKENESVK